MKKKRITIYSNDYWINKGFTEEEAIQKVKQSKKETSCFNKEFWIKKGFSEEEAMQKVKEKQSNNAKKRSKQSYDNMTMPWMEEYWIKKGFSEKEALIKVKEKKSSMSINSLDIEKKKDILEKRKKTYYDKSSDDLYKINKSRGRTKTQLIEKYGQIYVDELSINRGKGRRNSFFRRYSKISKLFFDDLQSKYDNRLTYGEKEQWIRYNSNKGFYVDCIINNKIIEFNGDFYHANPEIYESTSEIVIAKNNIKLAKDLWNKDEFKIKKLESLGYEILIIWEKEVNENRDEIINKCIKFLKNG